MGTTAELVAGIIEVNVNISLTPFIEVAQQLVSNCCSDAGYDDDKLTSIETWLAAHFYTIRDPRAEQEKAGRVSVKYQSAVDLGLSTSHYGQMAMTLDTAGGLAALNKSTIDGKRKTARVRWLGTAKETLDE